MKTEWRIEREDETRGSYRSYLIGLFSCMGFTLLAYFLVTREVFSGWVLDFSILGLSLVQVLVQLLFFLHLGEETKPRWNLLIFLFMLLVVLILVIGTLWIMYNLDSRMM